ncbi:DsbA family protein [Patulibacter sp.]|uniref:DsbA family protein n=1 Tax=Patulibacter sp. TaxID=1912859 RepID=UPI002715CC7B|nr:DsbA family protein [Patulibacter sp.]MDO9407603.1 DsbA family protein [Patulibacter sp.]
MTTPEESPLAITRVTPGAAGEGHDHDAGTKRDHDHDAAPVPGDEGPPAFFFDFGDPESYLAAERVLQTLPVATPWVPIDSSRLPESTWSGSRGAEDEAAARARIEVTAAERGLQPVRWPATVPPDTRKALLAAWYAKGIGRVVSFSLPAFRQAFAGGHDLGSETPVLLAASACEMHPRAIVQAFGRPVIAAALDDATDRAIAAGVRRVPAIWTGDRVFHGDAGVDEAAAHLASRAAAEPT